MLHSKDVHLNRHPPYFGMILQQNQSLNRDSEISIDLLPTLCMISFYEVYINITLSFSHFKQTTKTIIKKRAAPSGAAISLTYS